MKKFISVPIEVDSSQETAEENLVFKCDHCETGFKNRYGLNIHIRTTHRGTE